MDDPFLAAVREQPDDLALRRVYADWLEEQGDPRSEFLRVEVALADLREGDPGYLGLTADKERLRASIDLEWQKQLGYYHEAAHDAVVDSNEYCWAFRCPQQWDGLRPTEAPDVRYCVHCQTHVHYCATSAEVEQHVSLRHCVAIPRPEIVGEFVTMGLIDYSLVARRDASHSDIDFSFLERLDPPDDDVVPINNPE